MTGLKLSVLKGLVNWENAKIADSACSIDRVSARPFDFRSRSLVVLGNATHKAFQEMPELHSTCAVVTDRPDLFECYPNAFLCQTGEFARIEKEICNALYGPVRASIIGVTGTNGKTSTAWFVADFLRQMGHRAISIGTLGVCEGPKLMDQFGMTSPPYVDLRHLLYLYAPEGSWVALEVSSHALDQGRLGDLRLTSSGWTNLTQDHLDYHKTMEAYRVAKAKIRSYTLSDKTWLAPDQGALAQELGSEFALAPMKDLGLGQVMNLNASLALALIEDALGEVIENPKTSQVPGRLERVGNTKSKVFVDYAHTPDALEQVCKQLRGEYPKQKLAVVFGCGGDRDRAKRPLMLAAVARHAHEMVLTEDNPRSEDQAQIFADMLERGDHGVPNVSISDRRIAIHHALAKYNHTEWNILIAGKGHETGITRRGEVIDHDDRICVESWKHD